MGVTVNRAGIAFRVRNKVLDESGTPISVILVAPDREIAKKKAKSILVSDPEQYEVEPLTDGEMVMLLLDS